MTRRSAKIDLSVFSKYSHNSVDLLLDYRKLRSVGLFFNLLLLAPG